MASDFVGTQPEENTPTNPAADVPQDIELTVTISRTNGGVSCRGPIQDQIIALGILEAGKLAIIEYHRTLRIQAFQQDQARVAEEAAAIDKSRKRRWFNKRP